MTGPNPNLAKQPKLPRLTNSRWQALRVAVAAHNAGGTYRVSNRTDLDRRFVYWQAQSWLVAEGLAVDAQVEAGRLTPAGVGLAEQVHGPTTRQPHNQPRLGRGTWPPAKDCVHGLLYARGDDFCRRLDDGTWETWDHTRQAWFQTPRLAVRAIERDLDR